MVAEFTKLEWKQSIFPFICFGVSIVVWFFHISKSLQEIYNYNVLQMIR